VKEIEWKKMSPAEIIKDIKMDAGEIKEQMKIFATG